MRGREGNAHIACKVEVGGKACKAEQGRRTMDFRDNVSPLWHQIALPLLFLDCRGRCANDAGQKEDCEFGTTPQLLYICT
jgi:hypothetical protein